ncbi:MAG: GNAT family N-acetyltransferase [Anaerolineae bacterium]|nr:GNAT family N-acetyltransferase [Anaerolineae bacterium]
MHERGLRRLDPSQDFPEVIDLIVLGFQDELDPQGWKMISQMRRRTRNRWWIQFVMGPAAHLEGFVWVESGHVVGNLSLRRASPGWQNGRLIGNVVVHPDHRGKGIGRALMEAALDVAEAENAHWIGLEVRASNRIACGLYERLGFKSVGQLEHLIRPARLAWPTYAKPRPVWRPSRPQDSMLWAALAERLHARQQAHVLEIRPGLFSFGGWEHTLDLWLAGERERAWIQDAEEPQFATCVRTDRRFKFHFWEILAHPHDDAQRAKEVTAMAIASTPSSRPWPVITFVDARSKLIAELHAAGFEHHRTLQQMYLSL